MKQAEFKDIAEFYGICKKIVKGYPAQYGGENMPEMEALRLNTFAVVRSVSDFNADNVKKRPQYTDSPYFYSRHFANSGHVTGEFKFQYPALAFAEDKVTFNRKSSDVFKLDMIIIDQLPQFGDFYSDQYSKNRELEEVARDIRMHFKKLIAILRGWVYATFQNTSKNGWYDRTFLDVQNDLFNIEMDFINMVNLDSVQVEIFPNVIDGCLVGLTSITVQADNCVIGVPVIQYDTEGDVEIYNQTISQEK
jgi:hypothetical protein